MTFIIAASPFNTASQNFGATIHIEERRGGAAMPVGFLTAEGEARLDTAKLAQNIADFLNGHNPTQRGVNITGTPLTLHYHTLPENGARVDAVHFTFHAGHDDQGVSKGVSTGAALLTLLPEYAELFGTRLRERAQVWGYVMASGAHDERRAQPRAAGDSRPHTPPATPAPTQF